MFDKAHTAANFAGAIERVVRAEVVQEAALETQLVSQFVASGRKVKPFAKAILQSDEFGRGL